MAKSLMQRKMEEQKLRNGASFNNRRAENNAVSDNDMQSVMKQGKRAKLMHAPSPYDEMHRPPINEAQFEEDMLSEEVKAELARQRAAESKRVILKAVQVVLIIASVYLIFLIYGLMNTTYVYDARGNVVPQVMSLDEIREVSEYTLMHTQYIQARTLYERVLVLDYRLAMGQEDPLLIAPEYEKTLESISSLSVQIGALSTPAQYAQTMNMLLSWVQNDIALYCQNMSAAISQNNSVRMNNALTDRANMYNDFKIITQNIATLGSKVSNIDITDILNWSPEGYMQEYVGGGV